jgi:hypothetical protein
MKAHSIGWTPGSAQTSFLIGKSASKLNHILCLAAKIFVAIVPALAIVTGASWAITIPGLEQYLQASVWAAGFIFLALAIESDNATIGLYLAASGIALPTLAMLGSRLASEFTIVAAALIATWAAATILRRSL